MSARFEACFKTVVAWPDNLIIFRLVEDFNLDNSVNTVSAGKSLARSPEMSTQKKSYIVIYTRYSSDLQSAKSCVDQEREVRDALSRAEIDHSDAIVIHDEAESGTKVFRDQFARIESMMGAGEIDILVVDDQARLSRADNAFGFITDLVYAGGRFISTGEGIDTNQTGWELRVKVMELHNSTTIRELGRRVRRGQLGRVISHLSAGDFTYGYESFFINPEQALETRGPKPERGIRVNEAEAVWIRRIFDWFNRGRSISWIAEELTRQQAPKGHRRQSKRWKPMHVREKLDNAKYVGQWTWGKTRSIRNSQGKKKQVPVKKELQVVDKRDELRIIDDATWQKAEARLKYLKDVYGTKPGHKRRGPKLHHTALYPDSLLPGLIFCAGCGARMWQASSGERDYLGCPNRGKDDDGCSQTTRVPMAKAEAVLLEFLARLLTSWPEWLDAALMAMRYRIQEVATETPQSLAYDERQLREVESQIANLVDALADGRSKGTAVRDRLDQEEQRAEHLRKKIDVARKLIAAPVELPDDAWISEQLGDLTLLLRNGGYEASLFLREILGRVEADQVIAPGKKRGYARLRFRLNLPELVKATLREASSHSSLQSVLENVGLDASSEEFILDLGGPTPMDHWAPKITELRARGVKWKEIVEITGLDLNRAYRSWKRFVDAQGDDGIDNVAGRDDGAEEED
jgi:site-specific DNA recombinase